MALFSFIQFNQTLLLEEYFEKAVFVVSIAVAVVDQSVKESIFNSFFFSFACGILIFTALN